MSLINFNGQIIPSETNFFGEENRAFRYGDALFESMRVVEGKIPFWKYHIDRLNEGMQLLNMSFPDSLDYHQLQREIYRLVGQEDSHRIRLTIFRNNGGLYTPTQGMVQFLISSQALKTEFPLAYSDGINIGISKQQLLAATPISHIKTSNALPYILGGIEKTQRNLDNILLLNQNGEIAEAVGSNVFIEKNGLILTPPLSSGCVAGTTRRWLLEHHEFNIHEFPLGQQMVLDADAIFLTNAIQGIRWVKKLEEREFSQPRIIEKFTT